MVDEVLTTDDSDGTDDALHEKEWSDVLRCTEMYSDVVGGKAPVGEPSNS